MGDLSTSTVGPKKPEADFIEKFRKNLEGSRSAFSRWREMAHKYYKTYAGDPWDWADKEEMLDQDRPPVTYNYSLAVINAVLGKEMSERKEIKFQGVNAFDVHDQKIAEWQTNLVRTWWAQCDGHRHESQSLLDQLITGYGWGHVYLDMSRFPFKVRLEHVDPWEMLPDPRAKDDNLADARWLIRERRWTLDELEAVWPGKADELLATKSVTGRSSIFPRQAIADYRQSGFPAPEEETCTVWEYQFRKKERWIAFVDPQTQDRNELPDNEFKDLMASQGMDPEMVENQPFQRDVFYRCYLAGSEQTDTIVLQEPKKMHTDLFTYACITGFREKIVGERTTFFGLMHLIYEPQLWSAKVLSTIIEMMARSQKNGVMFEAGAIADPVKFKEEMAKPTGLMMVEDGTITEGKIQFMKPPAYPHGLDQIIQQAINGIHQITGVSEFMMGTSTRERSNLLISNYQEQSYTLLTPLTDPLAGFRIRMGRLIANYIQKFVPAEDIDRLIQDEGVEGLTIQEVVDPMTGQPQIDPQTGKPAVQQIATPSQYLKEVNLMDFDVVVDLGYATTTERQALWQLFAQHGLLEMLSNIPGVPIHKIMPFIFRMLPVPAELARELGDDIETEMENQEKMQEAQGMLEVFQGMDPQTQMQVGQQIQMMMQQMMQQQQQQQPQQQMPQQPQ